LCCETVYLGLGGGVEGDPVAHGGELGDVGTGKDIAKYVGVSRATLYRYPADEAG
jgi:hypothetical protein